MVFTFFLFLISLFIYPLVTVPSMLIAIGITVTFMFHSFFSSLARSRYLSLFSLSFSFIVSQSGKVYYSAGFFFLMTITKSGCLAEIKWSVCISKSQRNLRVSFSGTDSELCIYCLFVESNLNFLYNSLWITFPTQSCLVLYSFCANLLHSLIMWLIVPFQSPHNLHKRFSNVLSIFGLT